MRSASSTSLCQSRRSAWRLRWQTGSIRWSVSLRRELAPTGAKDPFGLRRAAIGVVQPLIEHDLDFDLDAAVKKSAREQPIETGDETQKQISDFITGRLSVVLSDMGYRYDVVDAVLAEQWRPTRPRRPGR